MTITLSKPLRKLTLVSVRRVYRCNEFPSWRVSFSHLTPGESSADPYPDVWYVEHVIACYDETVWEIASRHRTKHAAIKALGKLIRESQKNGKRA